MKWILAVLFSALFACTHATASECPCSQGGPCQCGTTCDCAVSGKGLVLIAAAPRGSFFGRNAGGSCANGQCTVPTLTATATPMVAGPGYQTTMCGVLSKTGETFSLRTDAFEYVLSRCSPSIAQQLEALNGSAVCVTGRQNYSIIVDITAVTSLTEPVQRTLTQTGSIAISPSYAAPYASGSCASGSCGRQGLFSRAQENRAMRRQRR